VGTELSHADGQTDRQVDRHTDRIYDVNRFFRNFFSAPRADFVLVIKRYLCCLNYLLIC